MMQEFPLQKWKKSTFCNLIKHDTDNPAPLGNKHGVPLGPMTSGQQRINLSWRDR